MPSRSNRPSRKRSTPSPKLDRVSIAEGFIDHLERPLRRGHCPDGACTGAAGGAACGDLIRISLAIDSASADGRIRDAGFDASGCGATLAAGSAAVSLVLNAPLLGAARIGADQIAAELG